MYLKHADDMHCDIHKYEKVLIIDVFPDHDINVRLAVMSCKTCIKFERYKVEKHNSLLEASGFLFSKNQRLRKKP